MSIATILQTTAVDDIGSVVVTDPVLDTHTELYVREVRVYSPPDINGNVVLQFTLRLSAVAAASIELTAPSQRF